MMMIWSCNSRLTFIGHGPRVTKQFVTNEDVRILRDIEQYYSAQVSLTLHQTSGDLDSVLLTNI
jgi:hypothetical protein